MLVDSNVLLDVATNDPGWGDWSARALAEVAEHTTLIINPIIYAEVSIGYTTIEALDAALPSHSVSARTASLGGRFPGREELPAISPPRGLADLASTRFLHWCACCYRTSGTAHPRCRPISQLFSESRDPRSHKARDVIRRIPWSPGHTSSSVGHNVRFRLSVTQGRAGGNYVWFKAYPCRF